jgi:hypothetical protein
MRIEDTIQFSDIAKQLNTKYKVEKVVPSGTSTEKENLDLKTVVMVSNVEKPELQKVTENIKPIVRNPITYDGRGKLVYESNNGRRIDVKV